MSDDATGRRKRRISRKSGLQPMVERIFQISLRLSCTSRVELTFTLRLANSSSYEVGSHSNAKSQTTVSGYHAANCRASPVLRATGRLQSLSTQWNLPQPVFPAKAGIHNSNLPWSPVIFEAVGANRTTLQSSCSGPGQSRLNPNPPQDTDGRREDSGRGVRQLRGDGLGSIGVDGRSAEGLQSPHRPPGPAALAAKRPEGT